MRRSWRRAGYATTRLPLDEALDIEAEFTVDGGANGMAELLRRGEPPTAIFADRDETAIGTMRTLRERGFRSRQA